MTSENTSEKAAQPTDDGHAVDTLDASQLPKRFENPGLAPHQYRLADTDPKAARRAERQVAGLFLLSVLGSVLAVVGYVILRPEGNFGDLRLQTTLIGLGMAFSLLGIGLGAVHWAKTLMPDHEVIELRHEQRGSDEDREIAGRILTEGIEESGVGRRSLILGGAVTALAVFPIPGIILLGDLGPLPGGPNKVRKLMYHTSWHKGVRLVRDPQDTPIKATDVKIGEVYQVIPAGIKGEPHFLEHKAKSAVLLIRLEPEKVEPMAGRENWDVDGIYAYSKICTHVGCPVALYEQQTHHLLCPCHQSTFDVTQHCKVIFGPAKRPLPQLPIAIDDEGYLVAQGGFSSTPGPSFWELDQNYTDDSTEGSTEGSDH